MWKTYFFKFLHFVGLTNLSSDQVGAACASAVSSNDDGGEACVRQETLSLADKRLINASKRFDIGAIRAALADGANNLDRALIECIKSPKARNKDSQNDFPTAVVYLLDQGANVNALNKNQDIDRDRVPHKAYLDGVNSQLAQYLVYGGEDPTALHTALSFNCSLGVIGLLLERGADPEAGCYVGDYTALRLAAMLGRVDYITLLEKHGSDLYKKDAHWGLTPFGFAVYFNHEEAMSEFLELGMGVNDQPEKTDHTPLMTAAVFNQLESAKFLLGHGADPAAVCLSQTGTPQKAIDLLGRGRRGADKSLAQLLDQAEKDRKPGHPNTGKAVFDTTRGGR
jgi:hypothetical protein